MGESQLPTSPDGVPVPRRRRRTALTVGVLALLLTGLVVAQLAGSTGAERVEGAVQADVGPGDDVWAFTHGSGMSGYCPLSDDTDDTDDTDRTDRTDEGCEDDGWVEPVDPEERCYEIAGADACLQRLVDDGVLGADVLAGYRCTVVYESLPDDVPDEEYARAGEEFERCMVDAGTGAAGSPPATAVRSTD